jgi:phosphatidylserine/phosphatidylglycerophosphate/cardiolipin synthase-like enzyme
VSNCRTPLLDLIRSEKVGIDVAFWFMSDARYVNELVNAHNRGVPIRVLMDQRANNSHPQNAPILDSLRAAGIAMREKLPDLTYSIQILHYKMMLFAGQNVVSFSKGNFTPFEYVPTSATNYSDEAIFFTDDDRLTNSFRRRFDDLWINTSVFRNYANVTGTPRRHYALFSIDPSLNFVPSQNFATRAKARFDAEPGGGQIDVILFRVTDHLLPDAVINAIKRGVTVRLLVDYGEYRNAERPWDAAHKDRMFVNGAHMKIGRHGGEVHESSIVLHSLGQVIFGSSNWTTASAIQQDEHNLFYTSRLGKPWFFQWFADQFHRKWVDTVNYADFKPLPPGTPIYSSPANGATGLSTSSVKLKWEGGPWAHFYDIYFGTNPAPPLIASNLQIGSPDAGTSESYTVSNLRARTTYYWRIVGKTWAKLTKTGPVRSFTTSGIFSGGGRTPFGGSATISYAV